MKGGGENESELSRVSLKTVSTIFQKKNLRFTNSRSKKMKAQRIVIVASLVAGLLILSTLLSISRGTSSSSSSSLGHFESPEEETAKSGAESAAVDHSDQHHLHDAQSSFSPSASLLVNKNDPLPASNAAVEKCMSNEVEGKRHVLAVGSSPVGTYICDYFLGQPGAVHDKPKKKSCTIKCPLRLPSQQKQQLLSEGENEHGDAEEKKFFDCRIQEKASSSQAKTGTEWDFMVFHYGKPPVAPEPQRQMVVFYSGESNFTEAKRARPEYQRLFHHVVSCHHTRRFYFTWTARFRKDFIAIAQRDAKKQQEDIRKEWHSRINAAAIFVSRCGKGGRDRIIEALRMGGISIHSFGKCQHTHQLASTHPECVGAGGTDPSKKGVDRYAEKLCVFRKYRYVLALDNTHEEDYVTEKIYHAYVTGAIPIYLGAPNVADFVPMPNSFIPLSKWFREQPQQEEREHNSSPARAPALPTPFQMDQRIRSAPKQVLDLKAMKEDLDNLDRAANPAHEEESAYVYWFDSLMDWRRESGARGSSPESKWSQAFWRNVRHREPTCDICNLALQRRCQSRQQQE